MALRITAHILKWGLPTGWNNIFEVEVILPIIATNVLGQCFSTRLSGPSFWLPKLALLYYFCFVGREPTKVENHCALGPNS